MFLSYMDSSFKILRIDENKGGYSFKNGSHSSQGGGWQIHALGIKRQGRALTGLRWVAGVMTRDDTRHPRQVGDSYAFEKVNGGENRLEG